MPLIQGKPGKRPLMGQHKSNHTTGNTLPSAVPYYSKSHIISEELMEEKLVVENERKTSMGACISCTIILFSQYEVQFILLSLSDQTYF